MRQIDATTFETLRGDADVPVKNFIGGGGRDNKFIDKFVPNINAGRWNDEAWLNLNLNQKTKRSDVLAFPGDKKIAWTQRDREFFAFDLGADVLEFGVRYASPPSEKEIRYKLNHSGLEFYYQSDDINDYLPNSTVLDRVFGSFAIYHSKVNNQYKAGVFGHFYRHSVIDANGVVRWCQLSIDRDDLVVTFPQMNDLKYPVVVMGHGDTMGYSTAPSSSFAPASDTQDFTGPFTSSTAFDADTIHISCRMTSGSPNICGGVLDESSSLPNAVLEDGANGVVSHGSQAWESIALDANYSIATSTNYWLAWATSSSTLEVYYDLTSSGEYLRRQSFSYADDGAIAAESSSSQIYNGLRQGIYLEGTATSSTFTETLTMALTLSEAMNDQAVAGEAAAESFTLTEAMPDQAVMPEAMSESFTLDETLTETRTVAEALAESFTLSESLVDQVEMGEAMSESFTLTEAFTDLVIIGEGMAESFTLSETMTDTLAGATVFFEEMVESFTLTESLVDRVIMNEAVAESFTLDETFGDQVVFLELAEEAFTLSDAMTNQVVMGEAANESFTLTEAMAGQLVTAEIQAESFTLSEAFTGSQEYSEAMSEGFTLSEALTDTATVGEAMDESITLTETIGDQVVVAESLVESFTLDETQTGRVIITEALAESLTFSLDYVDLLMAAPVALAVGAVISGDESISATVSGDTTATAALSTNVSIAAVLSANITVNATVKGDESIAAKLTNY